MHDIKWIRENPEEFDAAMGRRGLSPVSKKILEMDQNRRETLTQLQELQNERNRLAKEIGMAKGKGEDADDLVRKASETKDVLASLEKEGDRLNQVLQDLLAGLPNRLEDVVPEGADEEDNTVVRQWGEKPTFSFKPRLHFEIGEALGQMDFETAAKMSGARFVILKEDLARLEVALALFMLSVHGESFGYTQVSPPLLVRDGALFGTGQLPKFSEDLFKTTDGRWLIPTAEVALTNMVREQILSEDDLPLRYMAHTPCFRSEAGAAGKDTRGMIRQHQFNKVELVSIVRPEDSEAEHERMTGAAEEILKRLELPYQTVLLCSGDTGGTARKTYDLEVWLPGEDTYREISSCSNTWDYQARRMNARFRGKVEEGQKKAPTSFVHTLNGSGVAVGRALVAVLENYQQEDGSVRIPEVLRPYMGGQEVIVKGSQKG